MEISVLLRLKLSDTRCTEWLVHSRTLSAVAGGSWAGDPWVGGFVAFVVFCCEVNNSPALVWFYLWQHPLPHLWAALGGSEGSW